MIRKLYVPDMPQNERNRIAQIAVDLTKRKAYRECLGVGGCQGAIEGGHVIPRAWLRRICDDAGMVRVFAKLPINVFRSNPEDIAQIPVLEHYQKATVGSYTCRKHEEMFSPADNPDVDLSDYSNLNLILYRPVLATLWLQKLLLQQAEAILSEMPQSEVSQREVELQRQRVMGLEHYKRLTEECLNPQTCKRCKGQKCKAIGHKVFLIPGEPAIAVSDFTDGIMTRANPRFGVVQPIMNWGMTVLPYNKGHKVIFHHFIEEEKIITPVSRVISNLQGGKLQGQISYWILKTFEMIAISPKRWEQFGNSRREAILDVVVNEVPDTGFGSMERIQQWERDRFKPILPASNPHQINLFNPNKR